MGKIWMDGGGWLEERRKCRRKGSCEKCGNGAKNTERGRKAVSSIRLEQPFSNLTVIHGKIYILQCDTVHSHPHTLIHTQLHTHLHTHT